MGEYERGFASGWRAALDEDYEPTRGGRKFDQRVQAFRETKKPKRKPSAYNNFVSQKAKLPRFKYKSSRGKKKKGMTNMKAIGVAWRKLSKNQQAKFK
jgi:hypothetical protein